MMHDRSGYSDRRGPHKQKWPRDDMSVTGPPTEYARTKRSVGIRPRQREEPTTPQAGSAAAVAVAVGLVAVAV